MATLQDNPIRVAFGLFEADLRTGELWKAGRRIKLQSQPFKVMIVLLEHHGTVISREMLRERLWGKDAIGDLDHSLITAINKIREALGDTADSPRFVETLARRGYRWIAPVTILEPHPIAIDSFPQAALLQPSLVHDEVERVTPDLLPIRTPQPVAAAVPDIALTQPALSRPVTSRSSWRQLLGAIVLLASAIFLVALGAWLYSRIAPISAPLLRIDQLTRSGRVDPGKPSMESLPAGVTDGLRLYVPILSNGQSVLSQIDVHTGAMQPLSLPKEIASPTLGDLSPDGSALLLRSHPSPEAEQPFWIVPISGVSALRLAGVVGHDATWMPDGKKVLVAAGNQLIVNNPEDGSSTTFATLNGRAFWLRWSPDHTLLRFTLIDPIAHTMRLGELSADGKSIHTLLDGWSEPSSECCGVWTGDGRSFVFQSAHGEKADGINLWRLNGESGSDPMRVTDGPLSYVAPIAGRIGQRIYFLGLDSQSALQRYDPARRQFSQIPAFLADAARVEYSRDRQWVTWTDTEGHQWRARADGSEILRLTPGSLQVFMGHWSPDGRLLVLMAREPGRAWQIYLVHSEGSTLEPAFEERRNAADPTFSADGSQLVFGRISDVMGKEEGSRHLAILNLRTHTVEPVAGSEGLFSPRWSPDGRYIAALSLDQRRLLLFDIAASSWRTLAATSAADPVWSADSKAIFFHAALAEGQSINRLTIADGKMQPIASLVSLPGMAAADYFFCGLGPGDEPIVRTRTATGNVYSLDLAER